MCGACGNTARVSASTAELNHARAKPEVARALNAALGRAGGRVRSVGDRWLWQRPTGACEVFADIEDLLGHLLRGGMISPGDLDGASEHAQRIVRRATGRMEKMQ